MGIGAIAAAAAVAGAGAQIYSASQAGKGGGGSGYSPYLPVHSGNADALWLDAINSGYNLGTGVPGAVSPFLQQGLQYQNVDPRGYQAAGTQAQGYYPQIANQSRDSAQMMSELASTAAGRGNNLWANAQSLWDTANDPQNALRDRTQHQLMESTRAGQAARGITMSPYGAGLEDQANSNFLLDWNDRQLGRQSLGLQGLGQANLGANQSNQLVGADLSGMLQFMNQAPQATLQGGYLPMGVGANIGNYFNNAAGGYANAVGQSLAPSNALASQMIPYMYNGQGAAGNAFNQFSQNRAYDAQQMTGGVQGAFQGINQFANTPAGANTNNWLQGLFGSGGGYNVDTSGTNMFAGQSPGAGGFGGP